MSKVKIKNTHIVIDNYELGDQPSLERGLSVFDNITFTVNYKGLRYDDISKTLRIPRGIPLYFLGGDPDEYEFEFSSSKYDTSIFQMSTPPRNELQEKSIKYLVGADKDMDTSKSSQMILSLDTGDGKTFVTISALSIYKRSSMIITGMNKVKSQWVNSIKDFTDLKESDICDISSSKMIDSLISGNKKYKIYLVNHQTITSYGNKHGFDKLYTVMESLGIGVKVYDEAHLYFDSMLNIDLYTNVKTTIYLTATFERSDHNEDRLFKNCFKSVIKYDNDTSELTKRKHIIYLGYLINSKPSVEHKVSILKFRGFDKNVYIDYLLGTDIFFESLKILLDKFMTDDGRVLVLSSKIDSSIAISDFIKNTYPDRSVGVINSRIPQNEKDLVVETAQVISSTPKSFGTGVDIPGLKVIIMTEPYSSKVLGKQVSGRLREIHGENTMYIELVDKGFQRVYNMYKTRLTMFKKRCLKVLEIDINK